MLRREQAIAEYDFANGRVVPDRLKQRSHRNYLDCAEQMLELYRRGVGRTRQELHRAVQNLLARQCDCPPRRVAAFCKLLDDASTYDACSRRRAAALRRDVFRRASSLHPLVARPEGPYVNSQASAKEAIAVELGTTWTEIDRQLFADVIELQRLCRLEGYENAPALLARYNVAQAQAVLYDAQWMEVEARDDFKTILRHARLAKLMHSIERIEAGYRLRFDGPASVLRRSRRYGSALAGFLPVLLACADWRLRACLLRKGWTLWWELTSDDGLHSHLPPPETFDSRLEADFAAAWGSDARDGWRLVREGDVLHRGQKVFVPDFSLRHADGRSVLLEIVGYWTPEYLQAKVETLRAFSGECIVLAIAESLRYQLPVLPHTAIWFKSALPVEAVLNCIDTLRLF